jgi:hypothetical protein
MELCFAPRVAGTGAACMLASGACADAAAWAPERGATA